MITAGTRENTATAITTSSGCPHWSFSPQILHTSDFTVELLWSYSLLFPPTRVGCRSSLLQHLTSLVLSTLNPLVCWLHVIT
jgi:hypothetical protein